METEMNEQLVTHPLISIRGDADVAEAAELMATCGMGAVGVFDANKGFAGILTERDVLELAGRRKNLTELRVDEVVNDFPVVVDGPISRADAIAQMKKSRIRHLIVKEGSDLSIVSMRDILISEPEEPGRSGTPLNSRISETLIYRNVAPYSGKGTKVGGSR
jgi:signal-transduction protein with cAMP-binding, CBS, and nucleotidyltransferase domain